MKQSLSFFAFFLLAPFFIAAQSVPELENLEGAWYQAGRVSVCYTVWQKNFDQVLENRTFAIVCGDTVELSRATVVARGTGVIMVLRTDSMDRGAPQTFRLAQSDDDLLTWENENPEGMPRQIEWLFNGNSYATFRADGRETYYRRKRAPIKMRFKLSAAANFSTFTDRHTPHQFINFQNVSVEEIAYRRMPGQELAFSAGLLFPETPLCLNLELGLTRRQVGVQASFVGEQVAYTRDGVYDFLNTSIAMVPEIFIGKKRDLSISAGFYFDLGQQRGYKSANSNGEQNAPQFDPWLDIQPERGWLAGIAYRLPLWERFRPAVFVRNTFGWSATPVRALSFGLLFQTGNENP